MTQEIFVIYGMIERHLMAKHKAYYFTGSQNYASLNEELILNRKLFPVIHAFGRIRSWVILFWNSISLIALKY